MATEPHGHIVNNHNADANVAAAWLLAWRSLAGAWPSDRLGHYGDIPMKTLHVGPRNSNPENRTECRAHRLKYIGVYLY